MAHAKKSDAKIQIPKHFRFDARFNCHEFHDLTRNQRLTFNSIEQIDVHGDLHNDLHNCVHNDFIIAEMVFRQKIPVVF